MKTYVKVNSFFNSDGNVTPRSIVWHDGRVFNIDAIQDYYPAGADRNTDRYTVIIKGETKHLFFERLQDPTRLGRWYVQAG